MLQFADLLCAVQLFGVLLQMQAGCSNDLKVYEIEIKNPIEGKTIIDNPVNFS
jgi:hypothetical protein